MLSDSKLASAPPAGSVPIARPGGVPPSKRHFQRFKGYGRYLKSIYQEERYALDHMDCGQPPDARVFFIGGTHFNSEDSPRRARDPYGVRLEEGYVSEETEAWSPPDVLMETP